MMRHPTLSVIAVVGPLADDPSDQPGPGVPIGYSTSDLNSAVPALDGAARSVPPTYNVHVL
jgi:hypothetical protein